MHLLINRNPKENRRIKLDYCIRNKMAAHTSVQDNREPNHCVCQWNHLSTWIICLSCVHERKQVKMEIKWPGERVREEFIFFPVVQRPELKEADTFALIIYVVLGLPFKSACIVSHIFLFLAAKSLEMLFLFESMLSEWMVSVAFCFGTVLLISKGLKPTSMQWSHTVYSYIDKGTAWEFTSPH